MLTHTCTDTHIHTQTHAHSHTQLTHMHKTNMLALTHINTRPLIHTHMHTCVGLWGQGVHLQNGIVSCCGLSCRRYMYFTFIFFTYTVGQLNSILVCMFLCHLLECIFIRKPKKGYNILLTQIKTLPGLPVPCVLFLSLLLLLKFCYYLCALLLFFWWGEEEGAGEGEEVLCWFSLSLNFILLSCPLYFFPHPPSIFLFFFLFLFSCFHTNLCPAAMVPGAEVHQGNFGGLQQQLGNSRKKRQGPSHPGNRHAAVVSSASSREAIKVHSFQHTFDCLLHNV